MYLLVFILTMAVISVVFNNKLCTYCYNIYRHPENYLTPKHLIIATLMFIWSMFILITGAWWLFIGPFHFAGFMLSVSPVLLYFIYGDPRDQKLSELKTRTLTFDLSIVISIILTII